MTSYSALASRHNAKSPTRSSAPLALTPVRRVPNANRHLNLLPENPASIRAEAETPLPAQRTLEVDSVHGPREAEADAMAARITAQGPESKFGATMFASRIAKPQTKANASPLSVLVSRRRALDVRSSPSGPVQYSSTGPKFDFARLPIYSPARGGRGEADGRGLSGALGDIDQRPGAEDPVHQPLLDQFRREQGQPPGGIDEFGQQVGPSDATIKYRPQPIAVLNGPFHAPIAEPDTVGMEIAITVRMSGGDAGDLASAQDSEQVSLSFDHTGSFAGTPARPTSQSGFMSAANIPNDRHGSSRAEMIGIADTRGGAGSYAKHQLDIYTHARYGIINPIVIPNSGYRLTRSIIAGAGTELRFRVDKRPEACTVNGFTTDAGSSPAQSDEVQLRP